MSEPEKNPDDKDLKENKDAKKESENLFRILDDLLVHTNSSRRLFLIFIASALFFAPVALVLGGVLLGHPTYNIRHLQGEIGENSANMPMQGMHLQVVTQNGTVIHDVPIPQHSPRAGFIFLGTSIFIVISIVFAGILLFIAVKEYRFFSRWNHRFTKYKSLQDKVDKELGED
ncbi:hypothetical protein HY212_04950 [Candidatus Pacearchaeota archaeon]|nr:hypothetical protein [Candidatus Pacearchaeota archaeon]